MEFLQLKYFANAARTENFSHTAEHFRVPPSCISAGIKKLENELGVKLFDRSANKIKLNEYGKIFLQAIDKSNDLFSKAKADILDLSGSAFGELNLLILTNRQKITKAISEFRAKYPKIFFNIKHQGPMDPTHVKEYDVILSDQNLQGDQFEQTFWLKEEIFLAVRSDSPLSQKISISAEELKDEKFICMSKNTNLRRYTDHYFEEKKISPKIVIECDDPKYIQNYLKMGLGVTFFPKSSWGDQIDSDVALLRIDNGLYRDTYIYTNKSSSHIAHLFSQMLKNYN
ncbi:MAG: LysR family transcriptional regulator [Ruminococcaceae bacterium]|nr:LysR family transcriptional regulator [Oscillospiraceae bacterium]